DSIFAIGMSLALIIFFRRFVNGEKKFGRFLSRHSFTVYIIHPTVIVFLTRALSGIYIQTQLKFGLDAVIGIPLCFAVAYLVRKIPFTDRVL
ncbi:MAG: acyltransferase, partial [Bacillota bacterium]|nr:acyltransferase [Bacillota bacterium]